MYHVSAQGVDERMINVHYYYYYECCAISENSCSIIFKIFSKVTKYVDHVLFC